MPAVSDQDLSAYLNEVSRVCVPSLRACVNENTFIFKITILIWRSADMSCWIYRDRLIGQPLLSIPDIHVFCLQMATDRFTKENAIRELYNYVHENSNAVSSVLFCVPSRLPAVFDLSLAMKYFHPLSFLYSITWFINLLCFPQINESLEEDQTSSAQQLPDKLGHVITSMEGPSCSDPAYLWPWPLTPGSTRHFIPIM